MEPKQLDQATAKLLDELQAGLRHGFFEYRIRCEIVHGKKRQLVIEAGRSFKFTIPEEDLDT